MGFSEKSTIWSENIVLFLVRYGNPREKTSASERPHHWRCVLELSIGYVFYSFFLRLKKFPPADGSENFLLVSIFLSDLLDFLLFSLC